MHTCLSHPEHGFYANLQSVTQHFTTSPEISPLFGEAITAFFANFHQSVALPPVRLIELGPGNGTLAYDMLSCWQKLTCQPLSYVGVENSPSLTQIQQKRLHSFGENCHWVESICDPNLQRTSPCVNLIVANEFFDALPIRQFMRVDDQWHERVIMAINDSLAFGTLPVEDQRQIIFPFAAQFYEYSPESLMIMKRLSRLMAQGPSVFLAIDYGYETETGYKDTLQAVRHQAYCDLLTSPGECDLTAHVDFGQLKSAAPAHMEASKLMTQRDFLWILKNLPILNLDSID